MNERKPKIKPREQVERERADRDDYQRRHEIALLEILAQKRPKEFKRIADTITPQSLQLIS